MAALTKVLRNLRRFVVQDGMASNPGYEEQRTKVMGLLRTEALAAALEDAPGGRIPQEKAAALDGVLRFKCYAQVRELLEQVYYIDVYMSMATLAAERGFGFARALAYVPAQPALMDVRQVFHPAVPNARGNDLRMDSAGNVLFLTGANMAGKSTFMKSLGIALYLAHAGLPIPAKGMDFVALDGIYTTINLPDNLGMGASHFYAEVLRVKKIAQELKA